MSRLIDWLGGAEPDPRLAEGQRVNADADRCIQCGICGYNCPVGIQVRDYARQGLTVTDTACILCGNCVSVCPRGTLSIGLPEDSGEKML